MATNCEDVSARMMDLLYGELAADERATIEAHVAGCARCRSELDGFEKTRAAARQALDEAPPARVRAAIVKAAAEHLAAQAQPAARKPAGPDKASFWDRLRAAWAFPTLATVGALAVFLVAKGVFVNPERTLQRPVTTAAAPETPPTPPAQPAPALKAPAGNERFDETAQKGARFEGQDKQAIAAPADLPGGGDQAPVPSGGRANYDRGLAKDAAGAAKMHAAPKPSAPVARRAISDDTLDGFSGEAPKAKRKQEHIDGFGGKPMAQPEPAAEGAQPYRDQARAGSSMQFAPPPPPREAPARAKAGKTANKAMAEKEGFEDNVLKGGETDRAEAPPPVAKPSPPARSLDSLLNNAQPAKAPAGGGAAGPAGPREKADGYGSGVAQGSVAPDLRNEATTKRAAPAVAVAPVTASAPMPAAPPAPAPPPAPASRARAAKASADYDAEEMEAAPAAAKKEKKPASNNRGATETLAQRADRLFAEGRWTEAAEAYRELLRRDPHNDDADHWRRRLIAAENADVSGNTIIARKRAAAGEAKSGAKAAPPKASRRSDKAAASSAATVDQ
ncbi:MAG TPA: zf-HC2 domain-containing protein [Polyangia bacterium]|nr:zf-HC2 domain-containing protein [Polyangia bacterium]